MARCLTSRAVSRTCVIFTALLCFFPLHAFAADGSGTNGVSPTSVEVSSVDQTFVFTYTAAEAMHSGALAITIPTSSGWSTPQGVAGIAGRTTVALSGSSTIADSINEADSATNWTEDDTDACNRASRFPDGWGLDTGVYYEATGSISCDNRGNTGPDDTDSFSLDYGAPQDFSAYTKMAFWFRTDTAINASSIRVGFDDATDCSSINDFLTLPAISADTWTYVPWTFGGAGATRSSVRAICFYAASNSGLDGKQIWIDDILIGPGSPIFMANGSDTDVYVRFLQMALGETATVTYGAGGGTSGVDVPAVASVYEMTTRSQVNSSGALAEIASQPTITVTEPGELSVDVVDSGGVSVGSPTVNFSTTTFPFETTTISGTLGVASQKIRVTNTTGSSEWSLSLAPTSGSTAAWTSLGDTYDFNDSNTNGTDDADTDTKGGRLTVNPTGITITPLAPCNSTSGVSGGSSASFREIATAVSSITLASASVAASGSCVWDITGVGLSQVIPARQETGTYTLSFTLTIS